VASAGSAKVFSEQPGTISAVYVVQGQQVEQGEPLLSVATDQVTVGGENVNAAILATLSEQKKGANRTDCE